ncbi:MAG: metallophosphoesterase family protein [Alphaproteobacteria bacterium]
MAGPVSQIHLSWAQDPSTSLTVVWHAPSAGDGALLEYRVVGSRAWRRVSGSTRPSPAKGMLHEVTITGLVPDTGYEYRVASGDGASGASSPAFETRTAPRAGPADFRFAFICDTGLIGRLDGNATGTKQIIGELVCDRPLFILGGGDYAYANADGRFEDYADAIDAWFVQMQPMIARFPFMAQYGNHEVALPERFIDWAPRFAHPEGSEEGRNYSFEVGDVHFTALYVPEPPLGADRLAWLEDDLAQARRRGLRWLVVYQHEPVYGHGHSHPARPELRGLLAPIFERHRVDLHLSGHDQNYERTYPLLGVPDRPAPASTSRDTYEAGGGVVYAKVSPSGKMSEKRNDFSRFTTEQQPFMAFRDDTAHHYALITARAAGELVVEVYSVVGDDTPKALIDRFRVVAPK